VGVTTPPYRIETERLVIRCYEPRDAPLLKEAVDSSIEHLRPWMPWIRFEPQTVAEKVELMRSFRGQFDLGQDYIYGVFDRDESRLVGGSGLHTRVGDGAFEIGYWVHADWIGRGLATELTAVLTRVGFELAGAERIDIKIEPANERSLTIPRKLGYVEEGLMRRRLPPETEGGPMRDYLNFTMVTEELASSPCLAHDYTAYDATGRQLETPQPG
jgi:RimJ/RimL family protein N-acetyltransferase